MRKFGKLRTFLSIFPREKFGNCKKGSVDFSSRKIGEIAKRFRQFFLREKFGNCLKILSNFSLQK